MIYFIVCLVFTIICLSVLLYKKQIQQQKNAEIIITKRPIYRGSCEILPCESIWTTQTHTDHFDFEIPILSEKSSIKSDDCTKISFFTNTEYVSIDNKSN